MSLHGFIAVIRRVGRGKVGEDVPRADGAVVAASGVRVVGGTLGRKLSEDVYGAGLLFHDFRPGLEIIWR